MSFTPRQIPYTLSNIFQSSKGWEAARLSWELLHYQLREDQTKHIFWEGEASHFSLLEGPMQWEIWESLPFQDHALYSPSSEEKDFFLKAFQYLWNEHRGIAEGPLSFLKAVGFVKPLFQENKKEISLTSVSLPTLPFCSFFSQKALVHIPPEFISPKPQLSFLAENIYHEAIHQQVILEIFERDFFLFSETGEVLPLIEIPWRQKASQEMRFWKIDRLFHALSVYVGLLPYRLSELKRTGDLFWKDAFEEAFSCAKFLWEKLWRQEKFLTPLGKERLALIKKEIESFSL